MTPSVDEQRIPAQLVPVKAIRKIEQDRDALLDGAKKQQVATQADSDVANVMLKKLAAAAKIIKQRFDEIMRPQNEALKKARALRDEILVPIDTTKRELSQRVLDWRDAEQRRIDAERAKAEAEEERRRKIQEAHAAKGHQVNAPTRVARPLPVEVRDTTKIRRRWTYEITDESQIPRQYLTVDRGAIQRAVQTGKREIPGVNIFQTQDVVCA